MYTNSLIFLKKKNKLLIAEENFSRLVFRDKHSDLGQTVIIEFREQSIGKQLTEAIVD